MVIGGWQRQLPELGERKIPAAGVSKAHQSLVGHNPEWNEVVRKVWWALLGEQAVGIESWLYQARESKQRKRLKYKPIIFKFAIRLELYLYTPCRKTD